MSIDGALGSIQSITNTIGGAANTVTRIAADLGGLGGAGGMGSAGVYWMQQLRAASYRGVPFGVMGGSGKFGRRNAVHEYPFRDTVWVEDLGRSARRINMTGFLVEDAAYGGVSNVISQRERMIAASEGPGDGELVHPTLGRMTVSLIDFSTEEKWDQGRVFELTFSFIESGKRIFPSVATSTGDAVEVSCKAADYAASADFVSSTASLLKQGAAVVSKAVSTAAAWGRQAQRLVNDATNLYHMVGTLKGSFGRFAGGGGLGGIAAAAGAISGVANTVPRLIALGSMARTAVSSAVSNLSSTASGLGS